MTRPGKIKKGTKRRGLINPRWREAISIPGLEGRVRAPVKAPAEEEQRARYGAEGGVGEVEEAKFAGGEETPFPPVREPSPPVSYADNRLVMMVRDPWMVFTYWEVAPGHEFLVKKAIEEGGSRPARYVLRVYDVTERAFEGDIPQRYFDINIDGLVGNWYVHVEPLRSWQSEIGILAENGGFFCLARSNVVSTSRFGVSDVIDLQWMRFGREHERLLADRPDWQTASPGMKEMFRRRMEKWMFSPGISSPGVKSFRPSGQKAEDVNKG